MKKLTSNEIRNLWFSFFKENNHYIMPSSSLIPVNDKSLLWVNSGVATIKHYFDGTETPPSKRLSSVQKSIRTGDINNVGITTRHHTFFEMLGNFSIGDYFKKEAIEMAWDLLTNEKWFGIKKDLLYITVYENDEEAIKNWENVGVPKERIFKLGKETNFWDMGKGPSGPSSEIFFDKGIEYDSRSAKKLIENDIENDRYVEIWNIVFSEFNNDGNGNYSKLPQRNIDTGAGLERIASAIQKKPSNFETDLFSGIIKKIEKKTKYKYLWKYIPSNLLKEDKDQFLINSYFKAISDFIRSVSFAISDGALPSPTGRGYIIRKLIRKAVVNKMKLDIDENFLHELIDPLIEIMGEHYPLLNKKRNIIISTIKTEEEQFNKTLTSVTKKLNYLIKERKLNESEAFKLHETYGLPLDILKDIVENSNNKLDWKIMKNLEKEFKETSRKNAKNIDAMNIQDTKFNGLGKTNFVGYELNSIQAKVIFIEGDKVVFDKTPFYATAGGQESDFGYANDFFVSDVRKNSNKTFIHTIKNNDFKIGNKILLKIDVKRRNNMMKNHSAAHLLFKAMEEILNKKISQQGSKVEESFLRFDFAMQEKISDDEWKKIEQLVNKWIMDSTNVETMILNNDDAQKIIGISRMDNHDYGNEVRVVKMNDIVIDFCTGTHVSNTLDIEQLKLTKFEKKGSGIFRVEATAGKDNIKKAVEKINKKIQKETLIPIQTKISLVNSKLIELKIIPLINFENEINKLKFSDENYKDKVKEINEKFINELKNQNILIEKRLKSLVVEEFKSSNIFAKEFEKISIQDINKQLLSIIDDIKGDIAVSIVNNNEKSTLSIIIPKKNINDSIVKKIKNLAQNYELRGNGKNQQYIFGGKTFDTKKLIDEVKKWEF